MGNIPEEVRAGGSSGTGRTWEGKERIWCFGRGMTSAKGKSVKYKVCSKDRKLNHQKEDAWEASDGRGEAVRVGRGLDARLEGSCQWDHHWRR